MFAQLRKDSTPFTCFTGYNEILVEIILRYNEEIALKACRSSGVKLYFRGKNLKY